MDKGIQRALGTYLKIANGKEKAKYLTADLKSKVKKAEEIVGSCTLCERKCKVNRKKGELGWCKVPYESHVSSAFTHMGEEKVLVPSGTIFFSGCNFKCVYCQNYNISQNPRLGDVWSPQKIADWIQKVPAININFVGGEPTPHLHNILRALEMSGRNIPIVWNSNMYLSKESMKLLGGVVDVYLADFRYGNDECALKYSTVQNYFEITTRNLLIAKKQAEIIVRLLVLPNHVECCTKKIVEWIAKNLGNEVRVNIMSQYYPQFKARDYPEINRQLTRNEYFEVIKYAENMGLWNFETQVI